MLNRSPVPLVACGALLVAVACSIQMDEVAGRACSEDSDCPSLYACTGGSVEGQRTCEVVYPPVASASDGGADAGTVPTYCADIEPILAASCVSTCHGADTSGSQVSNFRLDYYEPTGNGVPGAKARAARIKARAFDSRDMPPSTSAVARPTDAQRALIARWVAGGAPYCDTDGGTDAGTDGGL
ncbi:hypothetical protein LZ198_31495 [Myxococcus sp. K15C18031901]|uniref:hypothetical protein n=1 Tax=Myxococcus dinghuensis TaxID=2906761 RepID=UPI0020A7B567|nr:hypothetical protein [Myxococcus dinghuensis]MCP3103417.1 hypothetical protein [Myxococcus dinghuensis]